MTRLLNGSKTTVLLVRANSKAATDTFKKIIPL